MDFNSIEILKLIKQLVYSQSFFQRKRIDFFTAVKELPMEGFKTLACVGLSVTSLFLVFESAAGMSDSLSFVFIFSWFQTFSFHLSTFILFFTFEIR